MYLEILQLLAAMSMFEFCFRENLQETMALAIAETMHAVEQKPLPSRF